MSRGTSAAARIQPAPVASVRSGKRIRTTLGDLIAAAYDAIGPDATAEDVARLLRHAELADGLRPAVEID
ncbi:hypothetical protein [Vulgatibacter sp.]|uniref:hypothetical protein n=1 Tax=Vulgatibacter sp. TaxID=1971226 RepID=UPI003562A7E8